MTPVVTNRELTLFIRFWSGRLRLKLPKHVNDFPLAIELYFFQIVHPARSYDLYNRRIVETVKDGDVLLLLVLRYVSTATCYNIPVALRLKGELRPESLDSALQEIVHRHEVLRTRFEIVDGEAQQVISPAHDVSIAWPIEKHNLSGLAADDREAEVQRQVRDEAALSFDLANGPLLRVINTALKSNSFGAMLLWTFCGLCVLLPLARFTSERLLTGLGQQAMYTSRMKLCRQVLAAPLGQLERIGAARLLTTLTDDIPNITGAVSVIPIICINAALVISCLIYRYHGGIDLPVSRHPLLNPALAMLSAL